MNAPEMSHALFQRVLSVRRAATTQTVYSASCTICGPLLHGAGTSIHAVCNPGHIVTETSTTTTTYRDDGKPINATERTPQDNG